MRNCKVFIVYFVKCMQVILPEMCESMLKYVRMQSNNTLHIYVRGYNIPTFF